MRKRFPRTFREKHDATVHNLFRGLAYQVIERLQDGECFGDTPNGLLVCRGTLLQAVNSIDNSHAFGSRIAEIQNLTLNMLEMRRDVAMGICDAAFRQLAVTSSDRAESFGCTCSGYQTRGDCQCSSDDDTRSTYFFREFKASAKTLSANP
jgi:hypothetical protein